MTPTKGRVLALWRKHQERALSLKDIRRALAPNKQHQQKIREILAALVAGGKLVRKHHGYLLAPKAHKQAKTPSPAPGGVTGETTRTTAGKSAGKGEAVEGVFSAHPSGFGFVDRPGDGDSLMIPRRHIGGALTGDRVRVELLPDSGGKGRAGKITDVLERARVRVRGRVEAHDGDWWLASLNEKLPLIHLPHDDAAEAEAEGRVVEVEITRYPEAYDQAPEGRIARVFGEEGETASGIIDHILQDLGLSDRFSAATRAEMQSLREDAPLSASGREDLRHLPFLTIDGEDARDFDDAVCLEILPKGIRRLWVAIADVAAYVRSGSAVDEDAYRKGTSVYLPRRVLPMLPQTLSNNLCSLKPNRPRLALTCRMDIAADGHRTGYRVYESIIESKARLTYNQVQQFFDGDGDSPAGKGKPPPIPKQLREMLATMRTLAATLRAMRTGRGALDFMFPELRFVLNRQGHPKGLREAYPTEATRLIEQFMVEANETVAGHCQQHGLPILYRVHEPPPADKAAGLSQTLWNFNLAIKERNLLRPGGIQTLLAKAAGHPQREQVELAILKAMSQAQYRPRNEGHFALAADNYCHFTSPIRRYPDLLVHRALKAELSRRAKPPFPMEAGIALSTRERTAGEAEGRVKRLYLVLFMESRLGETFPASVIGVSERGLWLRLREMPVEGLLPAGTLPGGPLRYDRARNALSARGRGRAHGLGDRVTVTLARADRLAQQLEFSYLGRGWPED